MLRHSTKALTRNTRLLHLGKISQQKVLDSNDQKIIPLNRVNVKDKISNLSATALSKYNEIIGFTEIDQAYNKVTALQESLHNLQNERTIVQLQVANIRSDLTNLQSEIHEHKRGEPKYLELMRREFDVIQEKNRLEETYTILDKKEREMFTHLQAKINMLHEKSRSHMRQWGIISTVIGALLGIIGTSISAYYRNNDIRKIQKSIQIEFQQQIQQISKDTQQIIKGYENLMEHLEKYEMTLKAEEMKRLEKSGESWFGYFKRKTVAVYKWCTFQKSS